MLSFFKAGFKGILDIIFYINRWREEKAIKIMSLIYTVFSTYWPTGWRWFKTNLLQPRLVNFPNLLSFCRIPLTLPLIKFVHSQDFLTAGILFLLIILTDLFDGPAAKAKMADCQTTWGKFVDPFADKVLVLSVMVVQHYYHPLLVWWLIGVVIFGETIGTIVRIINLIKSIDIASNNFGKVKYFIQFGIVLTIFFKIEITPWSTYVLNALLVISAFFLYRNVVKSIQGLWNNSNSPT